MTLVDPCERVSQPLKGSQPTNWIPLLYIEESKWAIVAAGPKISKYCFCRHMSHICSDKERKSLVELEFYALQPVPAHHPPRPSLPRAGRPVFLFSCVATFEVIIKMIVVPGKFSSFCVLLPNPVSLEGTWEGQRSHSAIWALSLCFPKSPSRFSLTVRFAGPQLPHLGHVIRFLDFLSHSFLSFLWLSY